MWLPKYTDTKGREFPHVTFVAISSSIRGGRLDNVCKVLLAVNKELFPNGRQEPLGQSVVGHNDLLPHLQHVNDEKNVTDSNKDVADNGNATDDSSATEDEDAADDGVTADDGDVTEDSSVNEATDNSVDDASSDSDDMADQGGAAASSGWWSWPYQAQHTYICCWWGQQYLQNKYPQTRFFWLIPWLLPTGSHQTGQEARQPWPGL